MSSYEGLAGSTNIHIKLNLISKQNTTTTTPPPPSPSLIMTITTTTNQLIIRLQVTYYSIQVTGYMLHVPGYRLHITYDMLQLTCYMLQDTAYNIHVTAFKLHVTGYMLQVAGSSMHVTSYTCVYIVSTCVKYLKCSNFLIEGFSFVGVLKADIAGCGHQTQGTSAQHHSFKVETAEQYVDTLVHFAQHVLHCTRGWGGVKVWGQGVGLG